MTATAAVLVFRCDALRSKISIASCAANYQAANGSGRAAPTDALRKGLYPRQAGLRPCVGCALGAEHAETGKARSGLHLTVLRADVSTDAAPPSKPFDDAKPEPAVAAVSRDAASVPKSTVRVPDATPDVPSLPDPLARAFVVSELRSIVAERAKAEPKRGTPWSERAMQLAVILSETHGAKQKELEDIGLNYFTVRTWVRAAKAASGMSHEEIVAEGHAAKGGVPAEVREQAIERLLNGENPSDIARDIGVSERAVRQWRRDQRIEKRKAAKSLNEAISSSSVPASPAPEAARDYDRPMPVDDEPEPPRAVSAPSQAARIERALQVATGIALRSKPIGVDEDDIVEFCERAGLGYRETQAVIAIVLRNPAGALDILRRELARRGAA